MAFPPGANKIPILHAIRLLLFALPWSKVLKRMTESITQSKCRFCAQPIPAEARVCPECDRFQDWRRHFNFTSTILSLVVALTSVLVVGLPPLLDQLQADRAQLMFSFRSSHENRISLMVHNTGNVAGALEGYAELRVPTEYLPTGDSILDGVLERRLPYNRVDLSLDYSGNDKVIIEPGASGHFEFVALAAEPWHWVLDMTVTVTTDFSVPSNPEPEELKELEEMGIPPSGQTKTSSTSLDDITVTPLAPRTWFAKDDDAPCMLSFDSVDVAGNQTSHEIEVACRRVSTLIALLPSRVSIVAPNLPRLDDGAPPTRTFEHTLVASGDLIDKETINLNVKLQYEVRLKASDHDLDDVFSEDSSLF